MRFSLGQTTDRVSLWPGLTIFRVTLFVRYLKQRVIVRVSFLDLPLAGVELPPVPNIASDANAPKPNCQQLRGAPACPPSKIHLFAHLTVWDKVWPDHILRRRYDQTSKVCTAMKAFIIDGYGSNEKVRLGEMPEPKLRDDDVLVQVHAASVNPLDIKIRDGAFKRILKHRLPLILGNDLAGVVVQAGPRVRRFIPGDEVYACADQDHIGSFAEVIAVKESNLALKPKTLSMEDAASIPLVGLTAWQVLVEKANLKNGQKVLIHAGSGGVGTLAIQLAKHIGATVATTASPANFDLLKQLGADIVIDYKKDKFEELLSDYDVVFDTQGGAVLEKSLRVLRPGGKIVGIAGPPDRGFAKEAGLTWPMPLVMDALS